MQQQVRNPTLTWNNSTVPAMNYCKKPTVETFRVTVNNTLQHLFLSNKEIQLSIKSLLADHKIHSLLRLALARRTLTSAEPSLNRAHHKGVVSGNCWCERRLDKWLSVAWFIQELVRKPAWDLDDFNIGISLYGTMISHGWGMPEDLGYRNALTPSLEFPIFSFD